MDFQYIKNNPRTINNETNDCVVRALSLAFNVEYSKAHELCAQAGREPRRGMFRKQTNVVIKKLSGNPSAEMDTLSRGNRQTLATFARDNAKGKWIVVKRGHAVALIDGVYHDNSSSDQGLPRSLVQCYYRAS
jgi:hypothetical protein